MMLVLVGFLQILVSSEPSSWRVRWTSRNAIELFSSSSLVNLTLGWISLRISLNCSNGSLQASALRRPDRLGAWLLFPFPPSLLIIIPMKYGLSTESKYLVPTYCTCIHILKYIFLNLKYVVFLRNCGKSCAILYFFMANEFEIQIKDHFFETKSRKKIFYF